MEIDPLDTAQDTVLHTALGLTGSPAEAAAVLLSAAASLLIGRFGVEHAVAFIRTTADEISEDLGVGQVRQ